VLPRALESQRQVRVEAHAAAQGRREVIQRLPGRVDGALEVEVGLVRQDALPRAVHREDGERRVTGERQQQHREGEQNFPRDSEAHARLR
jgi:hypothetical protein